jgi:hypothetical protein
MATTYPIRLDADLDIVEFDRPAMVEVGCVVTETEINSDDLGRRYVAVVAWAVESISVATARDVGPHYHRCADGAFEPAPDWVEERVRAALESMDMEVCAELSEALAEAGDA